MLTKLRKFFPSTPFILSLIWESHRLLKLTITRALAPLRRIVTREIYVFELFRNSPHPRLFSVIDSLECGHEYVSQQWSFRDLLYAYADPVESSHVTARRHRCHPCALLAMKRKPVVSVVLKKATGAA